MLPTPTAHKMLRKMLNESIPPAGNDTDTNFTDGDIDELLLVSPDTYAAAALGWTMKAAALNERIEKYSVGDESYDKTALKDVADHALRMAKQYSAISKEQPVEVPQASTSGFMLRVKAPDIL